MRLLQSILTAGWQRTLYILFVAQLVAAVGFSSIFPFLPLYVKELGSTTGLSVELLSGLVYSSQALTMMIASPFWGMLADRYSRKLMVERAMFGGTVILLLMAFVRSAEELVLLRAVQGMITGTISAVNALAAAETPREHTGYAMGLLQVGLAGGVSLGPLLGGALADLYGYSFVFYVTSALLFTAGLMVWFGVHEGEIDESTRDARHDRFLAKWQEILNTPGVLIAYGMRFLTRLGHMMIVPIMPLFIATLLPGAAAVNTLTGMVIGSAAATSAISSVYLGRLGDRIGHRRILTLSAGAAALVYVPQSLVTAAWQLLVLQALFGVTLGGMIPAISALLVRYTRVGHEGAVYGLDNSVHSGARAFAPVIGAGVALWLGLRAAFLATALIFVLAALVAAWRLPEPRGSD